MRSRAALAVLTAVLVAGVVTGFVVLPQLVGNGLAISSGTTPSAWPSDFPSSPNLTPSAPTHEPASGPSAGEVPPRPFGTGVLLQTDDFFHLGLEFDGAYQRQDGRQRLTACTGREDMDELTDDHDPDGSSVSISWHSADSTLRTGEPTRLTESVSQAATTDAASRHFSALVDALTGCHYRQHGHERHLGPPTSVPTAAGRAVRFIAYDADGTAVGGVGVVLHDRDFGVFDLLGTGAESPADVLDSLAASAVSRIS
ncbi:MAG: hypothetical protein J2P23_05805 [Microlunatus sp.]|nr:hypothetical protein [Microlunatus sp.]